MRNMLLVIAAAIASSVLFYFGTGLEPIWWCLWLAPIPLIAISRRSGWLTIFASAAIAYLIGGLNQWHYFVHVQVPLPRILFSLFIPVFLFGLGVLFTRSFILRGSIFAAALALPAFWVTCEYVNATN